LAAPDGARPPDGAAFCGAAFYILNLGCRVNRAESDDLARALLGAGARTAASLDEAALIIVNTCIVTGEAEAKTRKAIRRALAAAQRPWVLAIGCAIALNAAAFAALGKRVVIEQNKEAALTRALLLLDEVAAARGRPGQSAREARLDSAALLSSHGTDGAPSPSGLKTRINIKIQDGCDERCAYCLVWRARGPARSCLASGIVERLRELEAQGLREAVLTGVNIGAYQSEGLELQGLLQAILAATSRMRLRLSSLEPQHASDGLLDLMAASDGRLCAHLHLPLQSGCDRTLERMRRHYDSSFFAERARRARALMPHLALTTDVIAGFPAETEADFEESRAFCEDMAFSRMHVFPYSARPGTPAEQAAGRLEPAEVARRARSLRQLGARMRRDDLTARVGSVERVLVEGLSHGTSESHCRVELLESDGWLTTSPHPAVGSLIDVRLTACHDSLMQGLPISDPRSCQWTSHRSQ
jgi:threonylcarbamoyladenosine tRNA methylthiotransferase MtaB